MVKNRTVRERQDLFQQGEPVEELLILLEGKVQQWRLEGDADNPKVTIRQTLEPGPILGKYDLLFRNPHSVRARALEPC